ncbi:MAG: class I SAM-dependent methyltransferase [Rhodospirillales bacterium]
MSLAKYRVMEAIKPPPLVPPEHLNFVGGGGFLEIGNEFRAFFRDLGGLKRNDRVLDVGCGIGRMAGPLTAYLSRKGSYEGFDIVPHGIEWCTANITRRFPRFRFQLADIRNKWYNANGRTGAAEYRFPYPDASFDFVFLVSVFTHLLPNEVENYLAEISRVLKPGGTCFATWFILNAESEPLIAGGRSTLNFRIPIEGGLTVNAEAPEETVAYRQDVVAGLYAKNRLDVAPAIYFGSWCGRAEHLSYQDIYVVRKRPD